MKLFVIIRDKGHPCSFYSGTIKVDAVSKYTQYETIEKPLGFKMKNGFSAPFHFTACHGLLSLSDFLTVKQFVEKYHQYLLYEMKYKLFHDQQVLIKNLLDVANASNMWIYNKIDKKEGRL